MTWRYDSDYMDDIFVLFELPELALSFQQHMSSKHKNIIFSIEHDEFCSFLF